MKKNELIYAESDFLMCDICAEPPAGTTITTTCPKCGKVWKPKAD